MNNWNLFKIHFRIFFHRNLFFDNQEFHHFVRSFLFQPVFGCHSYVFFLMLKFGAFSIGCFQTENIWIWKRSNCWMFLNTILEGFFSMKEEIKEGFFVNYTWKGFFDFRNDDTDLYAASYKLFINNTIRKISIAFIELFLLFLRFLLLLAEVEILVQLIFFILSFVNSPLFLKFYLLEHWSLVIVETHLIIRSELWLD